MKTKIFDCLTKDQQRQAVENFKADTGDNLEEIRDIADFMSGYMWDVDTLTPVFDQEWADNLILKVRKVDENTCRITRLGVPLLYKMAGIDCQYGY
jgi:hypothetical protein